MCGWDGFFDNDDWFCNILCAGGICISVMSDIPNDSDAVNYVSYRDKGLMKATAFGVNVLVSWRYDFKTTGGLYPASSNIPLFRLLTVTNLIHTHTLPTPSHYFILSPHP